MTRIDCAMMRAHVVAVAVVITFLSATLKLQCCIAMPSHSARFSHWSTILAMAQASRVSVPSTKQISGLTRLHITVNSKPPKLSSSDCTSVTADLLSALVDHDRVKLS